MSLISVVPLCENSQGLPSILKFFLFFLFFFFNLGLKVYVFAKWKLCYAAS